MELRARARSGGSNGSFARHLVRARGDERSLGQAQLQQPLMHPLIRYGCPLNVRRRGVLEDDQTIAAAFGSLIDRPKDEPLAVGLQALRPNAVAGNVHEAVILCWMECADTADRHKQSVFLASSA